MPKPPQPPQPPPPEINCPKANTFRATKPNGKSHNYILVFRTSLNSVLPLDIPTACILYKISNNKKHPKYTQIALRNFIVRQDRENRSIYNNLLTGNFSNITLPPIPLIQKFISDALPGETYSPLTSINSPTVSCAAGGSGHGIPC